MSSQLLSSNPAIISDRSSIRRNKKKKVQSLTPFQQQNSSIQWKSDAQQQIYSSKLLHVLRRLVRHNASSSAQKWASKHVREAADRALASTAKGRSRWSRAILTNRPKLKFMKKNNITKRQQSVMLAATCGYSRSLRKSKLGILRLKSKSLPAVQRKAGVLGRLVPGCRKQPLPVVLQEAADYIPALEMQVRAMSALAERLSVSGSSSSTHSPTSHLHSIQPPSS